MHLQTENLLKSALLKLLAKKSAGQITVRQVCEAAGVSRQALYNHFDGIMGIVRELYEERLLADIMEDAQEQSWEARLCRRLCHYKAKKKVVLHLWHSQYRAEMRRMIQDSAGGIICGALRERAGEMSVLLPEKQVAYMTEFYLDSLMGMLSRYLDGGMQDDPEEVARMWIVMTEGHARAIFMRMREETAGREGWKDDPECPPGGQKDRRVN